MQSSRLILIAVLLAAAVGTYFLVGLWTESPAGRVILTLLATPVVISVAAAVASVAVAVLPVAKVPLGYNLRNLQVRWKTTVVTALAFTLVIALLTIMLAFVNAMDRMTAGSAQPGNVMVLSDGATDEVISNLPQGSVSLVEQRLQDLIEKDENGKHLFSQEVYVILNHQLPNAKPGERQRRFVQVRGLDNPVIAAKVHDITLAQGTWWSKSGVRKLPSGETAYECVIGNGLATTFGKDKNQGPVGPGEVLQISGRTWYVVGVMGETASAFGSEIWSRDIDIMTKYGRENAYSCYVFRTKDAETAKRASELVKVQAIGRRLQGYTETEYYARLNATNAQFRVAFVFVAIIMAVGGVLGVMNTMFAAISQRAKDIGVLRLLGFTRWQILMSFLMESVLIALVGGLVGLGLGYLADGYTASSIISAGGGGGGKSVVLRLVVEPFILGVGLAFALVMGAVGGLLPSLSAMRVRPLESLR
jgi:putative ABC transport system permease protein